VDLPRTLLKQSPGENVLETLLLHRSLVTGQHKIICDKNVATPASIALFNHDVFLQAILDHKSKVFQDVPAPTKPIRNQVHPQNAL
jgi:hypothetical protein